MKKILALALAAVTLLCCLVGCSFGEQNKKVIDENFYCKVIDENNIAIGCVMFITQHKNNMWFSRNKQLVS